MVLVILLLVELALFNLLIMIRDADEDVLLLQSECVSPEPFEEFLWSLLVKDNCSTWHDISVQSLLIVDCPILIGQVNWWIVLAFVLFWLRLGIHLWLNGDGFGGENGKPEFSEFSSESFGNNNKELVLFVSAITSWLVQSSLLVLIIAGCILTTASVNGGFFNILPLSIEMLVRAVATSTSGNSWEGISSSLDRYVTEMLMYCDIESIGTKGKLCVSVGDENCNGNGSVELVAWTLELRKKL